MARPRRLEHVPLDDLREAAINPKGHAPEAIGASIRRFGFLEPMVIDERTGRLIAGHGRRDELLRARGAGEPAPEGIVVRKGAWLVPVTRGWASGDDREAHAAGVAINRLGEVGGWKPEVLAGVLDRWTEEPAALGFDDAGLDDLRAWIEERLTLPDLDVEPPAAIRAIILDYPLAEYEIVTARCQALRTERGVTSNAALIAALVFEADA